MEIEFCITVSENMHTIEKYITQNIFASSLTVINRVIKMSKIKQRGVITEEMKKLWNFCIY